MASTEEGKKPEKEPSGMLSGIRKPRQLSQMLRISSSSRPRRPASGSVAEMEDLQQQQQEEEAALIEAEAELSSSAGENDSEFEDDESDDEAEDEDENLDHEHARHIDDDNAEVDADADAEAGRTIIRTKKKPSRMEILRNGLQRRISSGERASNSFSSSASGEHLDDGEGDAHQGLEYDDMYSASRKRGTSGSARLTFGFANPKGGKGQGRLFGSVRTPNMSRLSKMRQNPSEQQGKASSRNAKDKDRKLRRQDSGGRTDKFRTGAVASLKTARSSSLFMTRKSPAESKGLSDDEALDMDDFELDPVACHKYVEQLKSEVALQLEITKLELLASLVPARVIRYHMHTSHSKKVFTENFQGAALFADISGFSNLAERLVKEISHEAYAAENLSRYIGASLEKMVKMICTRGGDVVKFAGDAILAIFPAESFKDDQDDDDDCEENSLREATLCACQVALELVSEKYEFKTVADSEIQLRVHCGVGCGRIVAYHVHGVKDRWEYVVTGDPVDQIAGAEPEANAGQTVVSPETYDLIGEHLDGEHLCSGNFLLGDVLVEEFRDKDLIFTEMNEFTKSDQLQYRRLQRLLHGYVPPPALVSIEGGNGIWSGELRVCSTMFCRLVGLEFKDDVHTVQRAFEVVHRHVEEFEGTLLRFIVDDKGASVLSAFGLPPLKHENDAVRAIKSSLAIQASLGAMQSEDSDWVVGCSIGITTGEVFCGTVGGSVRCEYTLHGVKVNLAARFMVAAGKGIFCCEQTFSESHKGIKFSCSRGSRGSRSSRKKYFREISVKGHQDPVRVYRPKQQRLVVSIYDQRDHSSKSRQVGRRKEQTQVKRILSGTQKYRNPTSGLLIITGDAGIGKTRLCQYALERAEQGPWITLFARGDDTESHNRFVVWKSLFTQLLQAFAGPGKLDRKSKDGLYELLAARLPTEDLFDSNQQGDDIEQGDNIDGDTYPENLSPSNGTLRAVGGLGGFATADESRASRRRGASTDAELDRIERERGNSSAGTDSDTEGEEQAATRATQHSDLSTGENENMPSVVREYAPLLRHIVPEYFELGRVKETGPRSGRYGLVSGGATDWDRNAVHVIKLIVEIFVKVVHDLEHADRYLDVKKQIRENNNVARICLFVEDLQWVDQFSMEALYRLAARVEPLVIIMTARENMFPALQTAAGDTTGDWYTKSDLLGHAVKISLGLLKRHHIADCIKEWTRAVKVSQRLSDIVYDKTQGQPFFAHELIRYMIEIGLVSVVGESCDLVKASEDPRLPSTITSLMTSRIDRIPPNEQLTLKVSAVIGTEFLMHELASVLLSYKGVDEPILEESHERHSSQGDSDEGSSRSSKGSARRHSSRRLGHSARSVGSGRSVRGTRSAGGSGSSRKVASRVDRGSDDVPSSSRSILQSDVDDTSRSAGSNNNNARSAAAAGDLREISKLLEENIDSLVKRGFLVRWQPRDSPSITIRFSSVMLRESAYGLLPLGMRKALHRRVAEFYQEKYGDYLQPVYFLLAQHYDAAEMTEKAMYFLEIAGNDSLETRTMEHVLTCFSKLLDLANRSNQLVDEWRRASWYRKAAEAYMYFGRCDVAEETLRRALACLRLDATTSVFIPGDSNSSYASSGRSTLRSTWNRRRSSQATERENDRRSSLGAVRSEFTENDSRDEEEDVQRQAHRTSGASEEARPALSEAETSYAATSATNSDPGTALVSHGPVSSPPDASVAGSRTVGPAGSRILVSRGTSSYSSEPNETGPSLVRPEVTGSSPDRQGVRHGDGSTMQKTQNRGMYHTKFVRTLQSTGMWHASSETPRVPDSIEARVSYIETLLKMSPDGAKSDARRGFFRAVFAERSRRKNLKQHHEYVQNVTAQYSRVEALPAFDEIRADDFFTNVEVFLEASKVYELLASLIVDQRDEVAMERRFNALTLAQEACRCAQSRPRNRAERRYNSTRDTNLVLDLNDHKIENRTLDPGAASLDQLASCYASQALFFVGMNNRTWARELSTQYAKEAESLFSEVRSSSVRGSIALAMGEYSLLTGNFESAAYHLERATWIFTFLNFNNEVLTSLEMQIIHSLLAGRDTMQLRALGEKLYKVGSGIQCVNSLVSYTELCFASYAVSQTILEYVTFVPLDLLKSDADEDDILLRMDLQNICVEMAHQLVLTGNMSGSVDALAVLALLMQRNHNCPRLALVVARTAAVLAAEEMHVKNLSITNFPWIVAIFEVFADSFNPFQDTAWNADGSLSGDQAPQNRYGKAVSGTLESRKGRVQGRVQTRRSTFLRPNLDTQPVRASNASLIGGPTMRMDEVDRALVCADESLTEKVERRDPAHRLALSKLYPQWLKVGSLRTAQKQSIAALQMLLDIATNYADIYDICQPYATYCSAIFAAVKAGKHTSRSIALFEKAAEQARDQRMPRLKFLALLELAMAKRKKDLLKQLQEKFEAMNSNFHVRKIEAFLESENIARK